MEEKFFTYKQAMQEISHRKPILDRLTEFYVHTAMLFQKKFMALADMERCIRLDYCWRQSKQRLNDIHNHLAESGIILLCPLHGVLAFPFNAGKSVHGAFIYRSGNEELVRWTFQSEIDADLANTSEPSRFIADTCYPIPNEWKEI